MTIYVNGREVKVADETKELSYGDVLVLAGMRADTVTYYKGNGKKTEGILHAGEKVEIREGTVFNAANTSAA